MVKIEKLQCEHCGKEEFEDKALSWIRKLIPDKDFCSKKCSNKYIKNNYSEEEFPNYTQEEDKTMEKEQPKKPEKKEELWQLRNYPVAYKPAVFNIETEEYFIANDEDQARYWAKSLNLKEELKKALG